jgi:hypothetical protein
VGTLAPQKGGWFEWNEMRGQHVETSLILLKRHIGRDGMAGSGRKR